MKGRVEPRQLAEQQMHTSNIRNFCILAHVDHGKTTLSDSLVSSNGVISSKLAGKLRYLDSTEEEQEREITMHSSAISLIYSLEKPNTNRPIDDSSQTLSTPSESYLVNLVDCPGHIDFTSDVSTATRICDGALIIIDVVEGICSQTHTVLSKALQEKMRPCLALNKIDRLILELRYTPTEAFYRLRRLVENVNALAFTLFDSELRREKEEFECHNTLQSNDDGFSSSSQTDKFSSDELENWQFAPEKGNVIFVSALDCWGFGLMKFAKFWSKKFGVNQNVLTKYLFDDYVFNQETKKIIKNDASNPQPGMNPMFVTMVLEPIWSLYEHGVINNCPEEAVNIAKNEYGVIIPPREINLRDARATVQAIMRKWTPLADSVLRMVVRCVPNPAEGQALRLRTLFRDLPRSIAAITTESSAPDALTTYATVVNDVQKCNASPHAHVVAYVSKLFPVRVSDLSPSDKLNHLSRLNARNNEQNNVFDELNLPNDSEVYVALARVFSGVLTPDKPLYLLNSRHNPFSMTSSNGDRDAIKDLSIPNCDQNPNPLTDFTIPSHVSETAQLIPPNSYSLYLCLGPTVHPVDSISAGNIAALFGFDDRILKSATLCSTMETYPMRSLSLGTTPLVRVAIEPVSHVDLKKLEIGLKLLYQYDSAVEISIDEKTGQHSIFCVGEMHMEQCVKVLKEKFAKCELNVSQPLVPYRETVIELVNEETAPISFQSDSIAKLPFPWNEFPNLSYSRDGSYRMVLDGNQIALKFQSLPLSSSMLQILEANKAKIALLSDVLIRRTCGWGTSSTLAPFYESLVARKSTLPSNEAMIMEFIHDLISPKPLKMKSNVDSANEKSLWTLADVDRILNFGPSDLYTNILSFDRQLIIELYLEDVLQNNQDKGRKAHESEGHEDPVNEDEILDNKKQESTCIAALELFASESASARQAVNELELHDTNPLKLNDNTTASTSLLQVFNLFWHRLHNSVMAGFLEASSAGPLMLEPLHGVNFSITKVEVSLHGLCGIVSRDEMGVYNAFKTAAAISGLETETNIMRLNCVQSPHLVCESTFIELLHSKTHESNSTSSGQLNLGQLISATRDSLRLSLLSKSMRIVEPIYMCSIQCDQSQLGSLYAVLSKRRGEVIEEDVIEGSTMFVLTAHIPVAESFGFHAELLKRTSGKANAPQYTFSHWKVEPQDPFWRPTTELELENYGDVSCTEFSNPIRATIDKIRKRKGLPIEEKVVVSAEKQRNLNKKK